MNAKQWASAWEAAREASSTTRYCVDPEKWTQFWDFFSEKYARRNQEDAAFNQSMIDDLAMEGVVDQESRVLDIGCGPGTFTLALARKSKFVVGLDSSEQMLDELSRQAEKERLTRRIQAAKGNWNHFPEKPVYDLVFGAKTPAIVTYQSLMKMNRVSRRHGCLITLSGRFRSSLRDQIWQAVMGSPIVSRTYDAKYPYNILCEEGYQPNIKFYPYIKKTDDSMDYLIEHYIRYFKIFGREGPEAEDRIRRCLENLADKGRVEDFKKGAVCVIWWQV